MKTHVGIDVSMRKFDLVIHEDGTHHVFRMNQEDINKCIRLLEKNNATLVVMEATGGIEQELFLALADAGFDVAVVNPRQVRDFARACGKLAKTDKIDAGIIALLAASMQPTPTERPDEISLKIRAIAARRRQLVGMSVSEKNRKSRARDRVVKQSIEAVIAMLRDQIANLDDEMQEVIKCTDTLRRAAEIIKSVPGIGDTTVSQIVADLPELGRINRRQIASLVGLAPRNRDSGTMRGKRTTGGGRKTVRQALYMPTLVAIRHNPVLKKHYKDLLARGKAKMVALTACMRKLLTILNTMIAKNEKWNPNIS